MKFIKYVATFLTAAAVLFLLFNVFFGRNMKWRADLRSLMVDTSYLALSIAFLFFIFYYGIKKNKKMMWKWFLMLVVTVAAWLLWAF